jgi:hypothetical protein
VSDPQEEGYLPEHVHQWLQGLADEHFDGNWGHAAAAVLEAAYERSKQPADRWAELEALMRLRGTGR